MIVVGTVLPAFKMTHPGYWASWLTNAEALAKTYPVKFLAVLEVDGRGSEPFAPLLARMVNLDRVFWTFSLDDGAQRITSQNRLVRICTGRNLISHYAETTNASHVLFADADTVIPADALTKLVEVGWPIVGGRVPTYNLSGPRVGDYPFPVTEHMTTAGFLLVARKLFTRLRWRIDLDKGLTDDPCYHHDAADLGFPTRVREDCVATHYPSVFGPVEARGHDLTVHR